MVNLPQVHRCMHGVICPVTATNYPRTCTDNPHCNLYFGGSVGRVDTSQTGTAQFFFFSQLLWVKCMYISCVAICHDMYIQCTLSLAIDPSSSDPNATTSADSKPGEEAEKKEKAPPTGRTVKVNLTAEYTVLDLPPPSSAEVDLSTAKLVH